MNPEYSHILNIKVISTVTNTIVNDIPLLESIKELFLKKSQSNVILWKKIEWKGIHKHFDLGDIIINSPSNNDILLCEHVNIMLDEIAKELSSKGILFKGHKIIFKIIKPLQERTHIPDTIGIII
jgi:hypothetical protein